MLHRSKFRAEQIRRPAGLRYVIALTSEPDQSESTRRIEHKGLGPLLAFDHHVCPNPVFAVFALLLIPFAHLFAWLADRLADIIALDALTTMPACLLLFHLR